MDAPQQFLTTAKSGALGEGRRVHRVERTGAERLVNEPRVARDRRRHHQNRTRRNAHDLARCLGAVHARHDEVHENEVRPRALRQL